MKIEDIECILPGTVIDISDPNHAGRVKAAVPTLFDTSVMDAEGLPWIYPATMNGYQSFSSLSNGSKIWVLKMKSNYDEFWYVPMFEIHDDTLSIISSEESDYEASDVLISRQSGDNSIYMYYTPSKGIYMQVGDKTSINIDSQNNIILKADNTNVKVSKDIVYIGNDDESYEPAVMGSKMKDFCDEVCKQMSLLGDAAAAAVYPAPMKTAFMNAQMQLKAKSDICAKHTKIN